MQSFNVCVNCRAISDASYEECEACGKPVNEIVDDEQEDENDHQ